MLDAEVVPLEFAGIRAGNTSRGHRILNPDSVVISQPSAYVDSLRKAHVLSRDAREQQIRKALDAATRTISGARWREDKNLLDTVVNLTEFPSVILGSFDPEFLALPEEVLVTVMRDHQKYFAIEDAKGKLAPHFLAVLNTDGDAQGIIRHGNERVLRARFNDARFFWQADQKRPLRDRIEMLKSVTFQKDLGSYYEKTVRVQRLASWLCEIVKQGGVDVRPGIVHKAALLAKTDLTTELVKEFTELQGVVGGLYVRAQELDPEMNLDVHEGIATAVYDHYKPQSMDDDVARTVEGCVLSIADKADSIAGMFALGLQPSGSKDPFALRRQANGIVKTIAEKKLPIKLNRLMEDARVRYRGSEAEKKFKSSDDAAAVTHFFRERLEFYLKDVKGFAYDVVNAVLIADADDLEDVIARAEAVSEVRDLPDFIPLAAACRRMQNILRQAEEKKMERSAKFEFLEGEPEESKMLSARLEQMAPRIERDRSKKDYKSALIMLATLRGDVDAFFDKVMVMVEDRQVRSNRLALLRMMLGMFSTIADFSEIVTEGKESTK